MLEHGITPAIAQAAALVAGADSLLICAGAGMGVDSGLPDFRGDAGFWRAYPALGSVRMPFHEIANPASFAANPALAWGFYGHRLALYRATLPHAGFAILLELARTKPGRAFVYTSNVDGQFGRAGFADEHVAECHGSIHYLECSIPCSEAIWPADGFLPEVGNAACRLLGPAPRCPRCGALARPNILMFNDSAWIDTRTEAQSTRLQAWRARVRAPVVVELGAGVDIPSVRRMSERQRAPLIRINPRAPQLDGCTGVGLALGARDALDRISQALPRSG